MTSDPVRAAIVDDRSLVRESLAAALESRMPPAAAVVYCGGSLAEAVETGPDVLLLDLGARGISAPIPDIVRTLAAAGIRVVLLSDLDHHPGARAALKEGALGFVPMSASLGTLAEALGSAAAGELHLSADLAGILAAASSVPDLSPRELLALRLYASGLKLSAVARRMGVSPHTAREYLDRVRGKYAQAGREARTRTELYVEAQRDGLLAVPMSWPVPADGDSVGAGTSTPPAVR